MSSVVCDKCGQSGMLINPGVPCLRRYADNTKVCQGTMVATEDVEIIGHYSGQDFQATIIKLTSTERQALNRKLRKQKGICRQCSGSLAPTSIVFCEDHLKAHREKAKSKYVSKNV